MKPFPKKLDKPNKIIFNNDELVAVQEIFHDTAIKLLFALHTNKISDEQYSLYEELYEKVMYVLEGKELQ
jgi:deoxyadenosine/deoxycytidine kinase